MLLKDRLYHDDDDDDFRKCTFFIITISLGVRDVTQMLPGGTGIQMPGLLAVKNLYQNKRFSRSSQRSTRPLFL